MWVSRSGSGLEIGIQIQAGQNCPPKKGKIKKFYVWRVWTSFVWVWEDIYGSFWSKRFSNYKFFKNFVLILVWIQIHVGKSGTNLFYSQQCHITLSYHSDHRHRCHKIFNILDTILKFSGKMYLYSWYWYGSGSAGPGCWSRSVKIMPIIYVSFWPWWSCINCVEYERYAQRYK